jgi:hypothetical protein
MNASFDTQGLQLEQTARRRARAKLGWCIHALVFIAVNTLLTLIAAGQGRGWALYPAMGWALGLAIHGVVVFLKTGGAGLQQRLLQSERRRLQTQGDAC